MKKIVAFLLAAVMAASATACASNGTASSQASSQAASQAPASSAAASSAEASSTASKTDFKVSMVTDTGGVNDQSFNQSSWAGLQKFGSETGSSVSYLESKQESDYATNLDKEVDDGNNLIWGVGFAMADAVLNEAKANPDINFAIIDNAYDSTPSNLTAVVFRAQESSFLVGYVAAKTTKTNKVGFVGGISSSVIDQFEFGYRAGVAYGAKELNKTITVESQYAESFSDSAKGKAIASKMYSDGCDVVFHAAGGVGTGVIQAAKDANKFVIGVDLDQSFLAPNNVLTSAMKRVDVAVDEVSKQQMNGQKIGGTTISLGLSEDGVGLPTDHKLMGDDTYNATMTLEQKIKDKTLVPPASKADYDKFVAGLK